MNLSNRTAAFNKGCAGKVHAIASDIFTKPHTEHGFFSAITTCRKEFRNLRNMFFRDSKWKCFSVPATGDEGEKLHYCMLFPLVHRIEEKEGSMRLVYMGDVKGWVNGWEALPEATKEALLTPYEEKTEEQASLIVELIEGAEHG